MNVPSQIIELVNYFSQQIEIYRAGGLNETETRIQFINPFFEALGWDVNNKSKLSPFYQEVVHEAPLNIKNNKKPKAPDYSFKLANKLQFFVEAKKPSVNVGTNINAAFQLRRYGWSAKLAISILTDFEEFAVYDCRIMPVKNDPAKNARIKYFKYTDYQEKWEEIYSLFSKEAVLNGSLDKLIEQDPKPKTSITVDNAFLREIETWREKLAANLAWKNPQIKQRELNFAVQMTINRIIFLRICEDRGIEPYEQLFDLLKQRNIYQELGRLFLNADYRYNSGLFHFKTEKGREKPDDFTLSLEIDDFTLKAIIQNLYPPESPYEFSKIPVEILGQVYEQFLGKIIRLSASRTAIIEDKPEVRKAGGVYYTPSYIVDYIIEQTIGSILKNKTPENAKNITILDPACGSGSFLIVAYQFLLNWYLEKYLQDTKKYERKLQQITVGQWTLKSAEKKRILLNHIYGVDIDQQAVETTKLSLLLKVLEGESQESVNKQLEFLRERALPDLDNNIQCGNSLIASDYYDNIQLNLVDEEEMYRVNVFDWEDGFSSIMKKGGFDVVIGNPPWGANFNESELDYLRTKHREIIVRMIDSFMFFVEHSCKKLTKNSWGMIIPDVILYQVDNLKLRDFLLNNLEIKFVLNMGDVFEKVTRPAAILIGSQTTNKKQKQNKTLVQDVSCEALEEKKTLITQIQNFDVVNQSYFLELPNKLFVTKNIDQYKILNQIISKKHFLLEEVVDEDGIQRGVSPDLKEAFLVDTKTIQKYKLEPTKIKPVLTGGKQVKKYHINRGDLWLIYTTRNDSFHTLPNICKYIDKFTEKITCKEVKQNKHPLYSLHRPRQEKIFLKPIKFIGVITGDKIVVTLDDQQLFVTDGLYVFSVNNKIDNKFLLGLLNSSLFVFLYRLLSLETGRVLAQVKPTILNHLPIYSVDFNNVYEQNKHNEIVKLANQMLLLHEQLAQAKSPPAQKVLQNRINITDKQINKSVYELYQLNPQEIDLIEEAVG